MLRAAVRSANQLVQLDHNIVLFFENVLPRAFTMLRGIAQLREGERVKVEVLLLRLMEFGGLCTEHSLHPIALFAADIPRWLQVLRRLIRTHMHTCTHAYKHTIKQSTQIHKYTNTQINKYTNTQIHTQNTHTVAELVRHGRCPFYHTQRWGDKVRALGLQSHEALG